MHHIAFEVVYQNRPVCDGGRVFIHAIVVNVAHNAYDLPPIIFCAYSNTLAEGIRRISPVLACEILRDDGNGKLLIGFCPGEVASGDQGNSYSLKESGRDKLEAAQWGHLSFSVV